MTSPGLPRTFRGKGSGGFALGFASLLTVPLALAAARWLGELGLGDPLAGAAVGLAWLLLSATIFLFFHEATTVVVDRDGLRVVRQTRVGPFAGRAVPELAVRWDALHEVRDVELRRVSKHGSINRQHRLEIGGYVLHASQLGTLSRDGAYLALLEAVREAIGERLVTRIEGIDAGPMMMPVSTRRAGR